MPFFSFSCVVSSCLSGRDPMKAKSWKFVLVGMTRGVRVKNSRRFDIARVRVRLDYVARCIVNANHNIM
jgi:hypothetical protein